MTLTEIQDLWDIDSNLDINDLANNSIIIPKLHSKYYRIYSHENMHLKKFEADLKILKLDKFEFYTQGPTKETQEKGWILPAKGVILKTEVPVYVDADSDIIKLTLRIALQREKVEFLDSIIKSLNNRSFLIRSAIDFIKFRSGN